jgi:hypothetical protein
MQRLWAKVLAGEANEPGKFSKRTVALLASLDKSDITLLETLCSFCWTFAKMVPLILDLKAEIYHKAGLIFLRISHLSDLGLIRFENFKFINGHFPKRATGDYFGSRAVIELPLPENNTFQLGYVIFTEAGEQLASLCHPTPQVGFVEYVLDYWRKEGFKVTIQKTEGGAPVHPPSHSRAGAT